MDGLASLGRIWLWLLVSLLAGSATGCRKGPAGEMVRSGTVALSSTQTAALAPADIGFFGPRNGWIVGSLGRRGAFLRSTDGGQSWSGETTSAWGPLTAIDFWDQREGWMACEDYGGGDGTPPVLRTVDGGVTWQGGVRDLGQGAFADIEAVGPGRAVLLRDGQPPALFVTLDAGLTWRAHALGPPGFKPQSVAFSNGREGWVVGYCEKGLGAVGVVHRTLDSGRSWKRVRIPRSGGLIAVASPARGVALIASIHPEGLLMTRDGGATWDRRLDRVGGAPLLLADVDFVDERTGWTAGFSVDESRPQTVAYRTADGGITWTRMAIRREGLLGRLFAADGIASPDGETAYIVSESDRGIIARAGP